MSKLPFELLLALRYLRPKRTFVSIITLISMLGVTLGVMVLIVVISVMSGFDKELRDKILGFSPHLRVQGWDGPVSDYALVAQKIAGHPQVKGVSPFIIGQVLVETEPDNGQPMEAAPYFRGVDPAGEGNVSVLPKSIIAGEFDLEGRSVLLGCEFARTLGLRVGDRLSVYSTKDIRRMRESQRRGEEVAVVAEDFTVRGIFDVGYYEYNVNFMVVSLENGQEFNDLGDTVHGLMVMVRDPDKAAGIRRDLSAVIGPDYKIQLWTEENSSILDAIIVEKNVMFIVLFFVMIVAAFGIASTLITFVVQKTREIGMLKALGCTGWQICLLFLSQSAFVAVTGVVCGYVTGMLALTYRNEFLGLMNRWTGFELFPADIYGFNQLPALIVPQDILLICGSAFVICVLGGVIPAWMAGRLEPVEALRHE
jgi:lipoprotein-releasing system permease protein